MKKFVTILILFIIVLGITCAYAVAGEKKKIAVFDFNVTNSDYSYLGLGVAETLMMDLVKNKAYQVVERKALRAVLV